MGHATSVSPLAPKTSPNLLALKGVQMATAQANIRYQNRTDALLLVLPEGTQCSGIFTKSLCPSAAVDWCRANMGGSARALLVNSGNANAFTGKKGVAAVQLSAQIVAKHLGIQTSEVMLASTGVIGEPLDAQKFDPVMPHLIANLKAQSWMDAAKAIMTTDTFPKLAIETTKVGGIDVTLQGFAKGAGMIAPDMATMLCFLFTDANIGAGVMQKLLQNATKTTFNAITVDSDTSTSDTVLMFATGTSDPKNRIENINDPRLKGFKKALSKVMANLSELVVRDGEGARKLLRIRVDGALSQKAAHKIALSIANSPLVKTAIAGEDANWGRVVMAVGKAGERADRDLLSIYFGDTRVAHLGERDPSYDEQKVSQLMKSDVIDLRVEIGLGKYSAEVLTCDLTKEYVAINGDYRS